MNILCLGATSAIAEALLKRWAGQNHQFFLVARNAQKLNSVGANLKVLGGKVTGSQIVDFSLSQTPTDIVSLAEKSFGGKIDVLFVAHGSLTDQDKAQDDGAYFSKEFQINFTSAAVVIHQAAKVMEAQGSGCIAVITSVAGDRGRQSNYAYGAAKGALSIMLSGLRQRLAKAGVSVVDIRPGFVDTPMTEDVPKNPLFANPEAIAPRIDKAIRGGVPVVYVPWFWKWIMCIIKSIPQFVFKKLSL